MNPKQLQQMLAQAQKAQASMMKSQQEIQARIFTSSVGGGKVTVEATGAGDVVKIKIAKEVVDPEDVEMLEDLVLTAVNQAIQAGRSVAEAEMKKVTSGLGLGGLGF
ncbi:MAG: YbaB/EbfC family nucleoid-associated protein [Verrucomicrobia bacterium]|nr:YbaB/EbfC family nucleoid-associated protein [Verrucomicrobiota bacterium]